VAGAGEGTGSYLLAACCHVHAGSGPEGLSSCCCAGPITASTCAAGTPTKVVLHLQAALPQPDALAFCRQQHGAKAGLVGGGAAVLAAARGLVKSNQVRFT
jgi:hypothetical protein